MIRILLLILCYLSCGLTSAQISQLYTVTTNYEIEVLKLHNHEDFGLINDVVEDNEGYIWFTSTRGLCVYDGHNFIRYSTDSKEYPLNLKTINPSLNQIYKDNSGKLLIQETSTGSIISFDPTKRKLYHESNLGDSCSLLSLIQSETKSWYAVYENHHGRYFVYQVDSTGSTHFLFDGLCFNKAAFAYALIKGNYWVLNDSMAVRFSEADGKVYKYNLHINDNRAQVYYYDNDNIYFIDLLNSAIYYWNFKTDRFDLLIRVPKQFKNVDVRFIIKRKQLLLATASQFNIIDLQTGAILNLSSNLSSLVRDNAFNSLSYEIRKILCLKNGDIILATQRNLYRLHQKIKATKDFKQAVRTKNDKNTIISTRGLAEDEKGNIYLSYYYDISFKKPNEQAFDILPQTQSLSELVKATYSLNYWKSHLLWNNAIIDLRNAKTRIIGPDKLILHCNQILDHDTLWIHIWRSNSLYKINLVNNHTIEFVIGNELVSRYNILGDVGDIIFDERHENFWVGTDNNGILKVSKKGRILGYYSPKDLNISTYSSKPINFLKLFPGGLWFGCNDGMGSLNLKTGNIIFYKAPEIDENDLIHNRKFFSMIQDSLGNYYVGTDHGLLYFDTTLKDFLFLPENHQLSVKEFNRQSVFHASDGRYYFGGSDGLYAFKPGELQFSRPIENNASLKVVNAGIYNSRTKITRNLEGIYDSLKEIQLGYFDDQLQIECSLPDYNKDAFYSYRLVGVNDNWTEFSTQGKILLDNIPPGNYELQIRAARNLSNYNAETFKLRITKDNIWYNNPWITIPLSLYLIAAAIYTIILIYRRKIRRLKEMAQLRIRISSDLHDNVGSILAGLAMQSQLLAHNSKEEEQKKSLINISDLSRDAVEQMRDVVWTFDTRKDTYQGLFDKMRSAASKLFSRTGITYDFNCDSIDNTIKIHTAKRQAIYLLFKEALTNILRHSDATKVRISIIHKKAYLKLIIHDNGSPQSVNDKSGQGMLNMKMRAESIQGKLDIRYDKGFVVELTVGG